MWLLLQETFEDRNAAILGFTSGVRNMKIAAVSLLLFAQSLHAQPVPSATTFLTDTELRRVIETAPEEQPGHPGLYLLRLSPKSEYPVFGVRRTAAGKVEVHAEFTDVWYVIDGAETLVTGGSALDGVSTAPGEVRGQGIKGGSSRLIHTGEFAVIPAGTPHWVSSVEGKEILYIVVKMPILPPK
jgi:mannose-6-phosphate isomerase-like protein (cupin superfamily)